jgi:hypothetical protein
VAETGGRDDRLVVWAGRIERWIGIAIVVACVIYVFVQLQPRLLFLNTTAAGGDTGAHVWFPAFMRDHLLPHFRLAGWTPDYYAGFPAGQFYFPLPALITVGLNIVLPYNVAFKLVTALGPILLPIAAYVFGKGIRAPKPGPALMAVGATAFLFFKDGGDATQKFDLHIMGGTITSTLAGEFSFEIALAFALLFLGTFAMALDRRGSLWLPAALFAATVMSHLVVGVFVVYAGAVVWLLHRPVKNVKRAAAMVVVGGLLTAVWTLPLAATLQYTTDMRYEPIGSTVGGGASYFDWMFLSEMWFVFPLCIVAIVAGVVYKRRATLNIAAIGVMAGLVFYGWEGLRDVFGKAPAWNLRLLPFWYVMLYLLAGLGAAEIVRFVGKFGAWVAYGTEPLLEDSPDDADVAVPEPVPALVGAGAGGAELGHDEAVDQPPLDATVFAASEPPEPPEATDALDLGDARDGDGAGSSPSTRTLRARSAIVCAVIVALLASVLTAVALVRVNDTRGYITYWAKYNYTGYQGGTTADFTAKSWPEYKAFMDTVDALPPGRLMWEGSDSIGAYGTPLALMLIPYWTNERITTMEGLYYEASATTPYHFMAAATLMLQPSNPVRGLPYRTLADFDLGVKYLQLEGVRYYAVTSPEVKAKADANPALKQVATVPDLDNKPPSGWTIYQVADSPVVSPLAYQPVAVDNMQSDANWKCEGGTPPAAGTSVAQFSAWECSAVPWFNDPSALDRPLTDGGPSSWQHAGQAKARSEAKVPLPPVKVSNIHSTDDSVEFDVSRTGVPVMVKTSYFPNWEAEGAKGPWRATPDFMVVVPTSHHVKLVYGTTTAEWLGRIGTLAGFVGLGLLAWWGWNHRGPELAPAGDAVVADDEGSAHGDGNNGGRRRRRSVRFPLRSRGDPGG